MGDTGVERIEPEARPIIRTEDVHQIPELEDGITGYSETLLSIVATFSNSGIPEGFNARSMVGKSKRGEVALRLFAVVDPETERFVRVGFQSRGCLAMTACASVICSLLEGRSFDEALAITTDDVKCAVDGVPWDKAHTLYFAVCGARALVGDYRVRQGASLAELNAAVPCDEGSIDCVMCEHCSLRDTRIEKIIEEAGAQQSSIQQSDDEHAAVEAAVEATPETAVEDSERAAVEETKSKSEHAAVEVAESKSGAEATPEAAEATPKAMVEVMPETAVEACESESETRDSDSERAARMRAVAENNALADVFDDVREQSQASAIVNPSRWVEAGFIPEHMDAEDFEMFVYTYLEEHGESVPEAADIIATMKSDTKRTSAARAAEVNERVQNRDIRKVRSATRAVGIPVFQRDQAAEKEAEAREAAQKEEALRRAQRAEEAKRAAQEAEARDAAFDPDADEAESAFASLKLPKGYRLARVEGEYVLVPDVDEDGIPVAREVNCQGIVALTGETTYYLYDRNSMTDAYAHWSFLAAEDNPLITFADCVREDSRVYPRPMLATSLTNEPFCMTDDEIEEVWNLAQASEGYEDIERTTASNGDVYFYSTRYLSPRLAQSKAEWNSVGRVLNT